MCYNIVKIGGKIVKPKSINALMKHMRMKKHIQTDGSRQKRMLRYMGYFHGYKGYRYCHSPSTLFAYQDFDELQAVYNFDMRLKAILYPKIMFLETTIKNYSLEIIMDKAQSKRFADVYSQLMKDYKRYPIGTDNYKKAIGKRMSVRNKVYSNISRDYSHNNIVKHYYDNDEPLPIWAIFELLSLGEFGNFLSCLNEDVRKEISKSIGIKASVDADGKMTEKIVYALKDLRNSVAHNNTVFDTRFCASEVSSRISNYIEQETGIRNTKFKTIVDYIILIAFMMKLLQCNKTDILVFVKQFEDACETLKEKVPTSIFTKIIYTDTRAKLRTLKKFCKI